MTALPWFARLTIGLTLIVAVALFLGFVPAWGAWLLLGLGGLTVLVVLHRLEN